MKKFIRQFIRHPGKTGAVAASSRHLVKLMMDTADIESAEAVVELGPGTGVFTEEILKRLRKDAVFFALELNDEFVAETRRRCPHATVYHDSAAHIGKYLHQHGKRHCDSIISSLPWSAFDHKLQTELLTAAVDALRPGGEFLTYAYVTGFWLPTGRSFYRMLHRHFKHVRKTPFVWRNLPPAFIYHCRKDSK
jgi:phosphatidylethanolamine/phosphatidyl-N-methylethanolamine N-methyltransferase